MALHTVRWRPGGAVDLAGGERRVFSQEGCVMRVEIRAKNRKLESRGTCIVTSQRVRHSC